MPGHHGVFASPSLQIATLEDENTFVQDVVQLFVALGKDPSPNPLCVVRSCPGAVARCLFDSDCRRALTCTAGCGKGVNQTCIFQCTSDFENDVYDGLLACMFNEHDCMGTKAGYDAYQACKPMDKVTPLAQYRGKPLSQDVARGLIMRGQSRGDWMVAQGMSAAYDCFDCQFQYWDVSPQGYMDYVAEYKIHKTDGAIRWNFAKYNATEWPQTTLNSTNGHYSVNSSNYGGLAHFEDWRLLAADESDEPKWLAFYYCGSAPGVGEAYEGAFILTPDGALPEASVQERLTKMYADMGLHLRCKVDNSNCSGHPGPSSVPSLTIVV